MGYAEDIQKSYESMYNSQVAELERQRNKAYEDATNRENQTKLQYQEVADGLERTRTDAKGRFYTDRNTVSSNNAKQTQQTRDYMAKNNLLQSGESVDAMLRGNTDLNNGLGQVATNESTTMRGIDDQLGASEREKAQKLNELLAYRNSATEDYNSKKNAYYEQSQAGAMKDIAAYNEQLRREQVQAQQAAAARSYSASQQASKEPSITEKKNKLTSDFLQMTKSKDNLQARKFLEKEKYNIISEYGESYYKSLEKAYWDDMGDYYKPKTTNGGSSGNSMIN